MSACLASGEFTSLHRQTVGSYSDKNTSDYALAKAQKAATNSLSYKTYRENVFRINISSKFDTPLSFKKYMPFLIAASHCWLEQIERESYYSNMYFLHNQ